MFLGAGILYGIALQHTLLQMFSFGRNITAQILLHHERADRHTESGTETGIFHIDRYRYLWVMIGSKTHKSRVVAAVRILGRTSLATHLYVRKIGHTTRTACDSHAHALGNLLIPSAVDRRVMPLEKLSRHYSVLYLLYDMRRYVMAAVGYRGRQIGYLQRSGKYLTLTDGDGYDSGCALVKIGRASCRERV